MKKTRVFFVSAVALLFLGGFSPEAFSQKTVPVASPLGSNLQGGGRTVQVGSQGSEGAGRLSKDDDKDKDKDKKPKRPKKPKSPKE